MLAETVDHDPSTLQALEERLGEIHRLLRRYGDDEATVIAHGERSAAEAARLRGLEDERARRADEDARLLLAVADAAATLSLLRAGTAAELGGAVVGGARGARVPGRRVRGGARPPAGGPRRPRGRGRRRRGRVRRARASTPSCSSSARTPASPPGRSRGSPRAASCRGSRSRSSRSSPRSTHTPTLVFDEIDTGIGGRSADPVGRSLWTLAREHQVLCVTHLPQIAAYADAHYRIAKRERDGRTVTEIVRLDRAERERSSPR